MTIKALGFLAPLALALFVAAPSDAAPTAPAVVAREAPVARPLKVVGKISMSNASGVPDEQKFLDAMLVGKNNVPLANKTITFTLEPKNGNKVPANQAH